MAKNIQPIFRALTNDRNIITVDISNNEISNEGINYLAKSVSSMKKLLKLDLSGNFILADGISTLSSIPLNNLTELNLSFNPFGDDGIIHLSRLLDGFVNLKKLNLACCEIANFSNVSLNLKNLQSFDISFNENLSGDSVRKCLSELNAFKIEDLNLSYTAKYNDFAEDVMKFFSVGGQHQINELNLIACGLDDSGVTDILDSLKSYSSIKTLKLSENNLTCMTLKYLFNCTIPIGSIHLLGCSNLLKDLNVDEILNGSNLNYPNEINISLNKTMKRECQDLLENLWAKCWSFQARYNEKFDKMRMYIDI